MRILLFSCLVGFLFSCRSDPGSRPPFDPTDALATFQIPEGFQIELFAAEPLIADPVAMEVDEEGRVWVVEMHGYPLDVSGSGKVKILKDTDGDGTPDASTTFAEDLVLPSGIMRWGKGVIVTDAPDVLYLEDTDGDDWADVRKVMLTGFARSNPQHNLNTPRFELDNWIYLGHEGTISTTRYAEAFGGMGEEIHFPGHSEGPRLPRNANGRSVRFQVDPPRVEMLSGETQFGYTFDPWGHLINTSNYYYIFQEVLAARYLERNPDFLLEDPHQFMPVGGPGTTVYPITRNPEHQLLTDAGVITSGCGITWYQGGLFPELYDQVTFVAEPVHNLVHTDIIEPDGASFTARPQFAQSEFLASTDSWFRPVNLYIGPDGALYVLDYYRKIIEHPEWMSDAINASGELYQGTDMGRIYRISPTGSEEPDFMNRLVLDASPSEEITGHLGSDNIWWRRTAQRLLVAEKRQDAVPALRNMVQAGKSPEARLHALWTLKGLGALSEEDLAKALRDEHPGIRENAIRLSEPLLPENSALLSTIQAFAEDEDPKVRFQALCTLAGMPDASSQREARSILMKDLDDPWVRHAAFTAPYPFDLEELLRQMEKADPHFALPFLEKLAEMIGRRGNGEEIENLLRRTRDMQETKPLLAATLLRGLSRTVAQSDFPLLLWLDSHPLQLFPAGESHELRRATISLYRAAGYFERKGPQIEKIGKIGVEYALATEQDLDYREDAIKVVGLACREKAVSPLLILLDPAVEADLQHAVLDAIEPYADLAIADTLLHRWPSLTPEIRSRAIDLFMTDDSLRHALLDAVEDGIVLQEQIGWGRSVPLLNADDEEVRAHARQVLQGNESSGRRTQLAFAEILDLKGQAGKGKAVFDRECAMCHQVNGKDGLAIGPDLASVRNRTPEAILLDVLEPNTSLADGYELWALTLNDGTRLSGIITTETSRSLTLRGLQGDDTQVAREEIFRLEAQTTSAMPEGLSARIGNQELADLVAFLLGR